MDVGSIIIENLKAIKELLEEHQELTIKSNLFKQDIEHLENFG